MRLLLVEDDALIADAIVRGLSLAGFRVDHAKNAEQARTALRAEYFDLAIIDIGLPDADGLTLVRGLRSVGKATPVLVLTARYALQDKIRAFDVGADDFLMKPFEQAELAARCRALVRRAGMAPSGLLRLGRVTIDLNGHVLLIDSQPIELTRSEWIVLESLAHSVGRVVTKERLQQDLANGDQELSNNAIETQLSRLRAKLGDAAVIRTIRGLGYRLDEGATAKPS
jgi:two-component system, OmpR family, response regulator